MHNLNEQRLIDLYNLVKSREQMGYQWSQKEIRDLLFLYAMSLSHKKPEIALKKFTDFSKLVPCRSKNFTITMIKQIPNYCRYFQKMQSCRYKFFNETIIDMLNITNDELQNMKSIISDEMRIERERQALEDELERLRIEEQIEESIRKYQLEEEMKNYRDPIFNCETDDKSNDDPFAI